MEYLMSYGWAILVVLVVGAVVWKSGVLDLNSAGPPTSTGFLFLKPVLANCQISDRAGIWGCGNPGFSCYFLNTMSTTMRVRTIIASFDGRYTDEVNFFDWGKKSTSCGFCTCRGMSIAVNEDTPQVPVGVAYCGLDYVPIEPGNQLYVTPLSDNVNFKYTHNIVPGQRYRVDLTIIYDADIGGHWVNKSEQGQIMLTAGKNMC